MQPKPITQYALYYSYSNVPFDNCEADWHVWATTYDTFEDAEAVRQAFMAENAADGWEEYYIIMEEVTERKILYSEVEND